MGALGAHDRRSLSVLGFRVQPLDMGAAVAACLEAIDQRRPVSIGVLNAAKIVHTRRDPTLKAALQGCDLLLADGQSVVWAGRLLGVPLPERIAGIDLFLELLAAAERRGDRVFLLGARSDVLDRVRAHLHRDFPGLILAGARDGYFSEDAEPAVAAEIRRSAADMLFVAMSSPKKERFLARWQSTMQVPVCHGVGGSFDIVAGKTKRAPRVWQRLGLEWLYRLLQEPGRLWKRYLITNTVFTGLVLREVITRRRAPRQLGT